MATQLCADKANPPPLNQPTPTPRPGCALPSKVYTRPQLHTRDALSAKTTQPCFCKWLLWMDGFPCGLFTPFFMVTLESKGILRKASRRCSSCRLCTENTHTHIHKGHLIAPLPTKPASNRQLSREPSIANSYRCRVKYSICIQITKSKATAVFCFFKSLEYCLNCELSFNRQLITLWQHSELSIIAMAMAQLFRGISGLLAAGWPSWLLSILMSTRRAVASDISRKSVASPASCI